MLCQVLGGFGMVFEVLGVKVNFSLNFINWTRRWKEHQFGRGDACRRNACGVIGYVGFIVRMQRVHM